ncbi:MAG: 2-oxoglutarate dehydrogenase complex dihydrolipoyllysine-residue succinyltransferase, partial [Chloroflexota bacterium]|nr:2-oxoglutarate dehydrogenase complex dihydrolipoyllysine-residue succinyltransferase [Chloroflexota bacterium]
ESLVDAVVGQWLKSEGDAVSRGETVVELETDKVNLDVTAEDDGVLARIDKSEGSVVTVGEVLGMVEAGTAENGASGNGAIASPPAAETVATTAPAPQPVSDPEAGTTVPFATAETAGAVTPDGQEAPAGAAPTDNGGGRAAPAVRRLAEEHELDLSQITGTGPSGRITREDVLGQIERGRAAPSMTPAPAATQTTPAPAPAAAKPVSAPASRPETSSREERVRFSRRRQTIAARLVEAQRTAAMLTTFNEVDMTAVMEIRSRRKDAFKERHGVGLGFMSFFTKAAVGALKTFPHVNAELQGEELVLKHYYDIGIAVGLDEGLVVPVVRDADGKSFAAIEREIGELAAKARDNNLALSELTGGTFTITNGGVFGSLLSTPILNTPQVGILGMHTIQQRPVARDGAVVIRPMMYLALSYDHRVVDGREAVQFLIRIKELIEDPGALLLEG